MNGDKFFEPVSGAKSPRFAGVPSFMRLPAMDFDHDRIDDVQIGLIGVPWDGGTTNSHGARHGTRQLRDLSTMIRATHTVSYISPFKMTNCADLGDCPVNPADLNDTLDRVTNFYSELKSRGIVPMTAGGDHLVSLPVLRGLASDGPVGMIHFDAHTDLFDSNFDGFKFTHGTPFRRAIEEGLLDPKRVVQIGIRGTMYDGEDIEWGRSQGVTIITMDEFADHTIGEVMQQARQTVGDAPTYVSFDIDCICLLYTSPSPRD